MTTKSANWLCLGTKISLPQNYIVHNTISKFLLFLNILFELFSFFLFEGKLYIVKVWFKLEIKKLNSWAHRNHIALVSLITQLLKNNNKKS